MKYLDEAGFAHFWDNVKALAPQDYSQLIYQCAYPTNKLFYNNSTGKPEVYVYIPKFRLCDVLSTDDTTIHPAFIVNGVEINGFYIGKFQSHVEDKKAYSLPAVDPSANMTLDQAVTYNRNKGRGFHEITAAEWAAIALWCHKNGTEPRGNNNYGKDSTETLYKAVPTSYDKDGKIQHVATGTGPVTWSHDGTLEGIWDMNGNLWERCTGIRLMNGELQVIPYNDAADPTCDFSATSPAWKALYAAATTWDELFVSPYENPGFGTVKLDQYGTAWAYSTAIGHATTSKGCMFSEVTADASIGDKAKLLLMALAILPDTNLTGTSIVTDYNRDYFWANNAEAERCLIRGGSYTSGGDAGVFLSALSYAGSKSPVDVGGRSAFIEL